MTINPLDALSALTQQAQLPNAGALNGVNTGAFNGAISGALNANPPAGALPSGVTAPVSESFGNMLGTQGTTPVTSSAAAGGASPTTWGHMVQQMVMDVNNKQSDANAMVNDVLKGGPTPVHQAMVATEEASLSFEFLTEVRNKVLDAYNQIMQMQV
ncbi:MAG TPA: flagellar hook-basal body complex protein FliE [Candidatus Methylacidiphilales bacterium]|nr:flagellar hook-basal body complex protein FliE [Candidatus Methylacidiphilales bacterium]